MSESLKARVRDKILRQRGEDGGRPVADAEGDDPRLMDIRADLALLDQVGEDDPVVHRLAEKYWVP
ncbi:MAG: hypothetical protein GXY65_04115 [Rhodococcus sp.]|uniref:hypothetical protein n=1 Tax=Rhodococcus TaxID=1827 RepID=UPI0016AEB4FC|nr:MULTISPECIES: hypothetical protein [Rhodococcus]NLV78523.1 hypothetical protein [Rhodococcus sp. (in: high G+C Gram-positive bacteria)]